MEVDYDIAKRRNDKVKIKNKNRPRIMGKTENGKLVIGNLFFIVESLGVPIEETINKIYNEGNLIDWYDFYKSGEKSGWNHKTIFDKISYGFEESDYNNLKDDIINTLKYILIIEMEKKKASD